MQALRLLLPFLASCAWADPDAAAEPDAAADLGVHHHGGHGGGYGHPTPPPAYGHPPEPSYAPGKLTDGEEEFILGKSHVIFGGMATSPII